MLHENRLGPDHRNLVVQFFFDGERDRVKCSFKDSRDEIIRDVTEDDVQRHNAEWLLYEASKPKQAAPEGTPLSAVPGIDRGLMLSLRLKGIQTAEQLARLDDYGAHQLTANGLALRDAAAHLVELNELRAAKTAPATKKQAAA